MDVEHEVVEVDPSRLLVVDWRQNEKGARVSGTGKKEARLDFKEKV